jgi:UDP-N-acetylglucosamine--N-acetylmuramyl-(pentapeptide) pyrophosphoryl-undecaprenol N-acetylglucosamine transferase
VSTKLKLPRQKRVLIAAAGTGGHIFPGLAIAEALTVKGWNVVWLGTKDGMENRLVSQQEIKFESVKFGGTRGKGLNTWLQMPYRLVIAVIQCGKIIYKVKPDLVIGFGGYVTLPTGLAAKLMAKPLAIHEQNSVIGLSNKVLSFLTKNVFASFPNVSTNALVTGNPLRDEFFKVESPEIRFQNRIGPLNILIIGGSLGARFLNETVPQAIKLIPESSRPKITHQSGANQDADLHKLYKKLNVEAKVVPFIKNTAEAFADADLIICRAGASTVSEIAAVGAAAMFVPLPLAVDDHQTKNAMYLVLKNAAWMQAQIDLTPEKLAIEIAKMNRQILLNTAEAAKKLCMPDAVNQIINVCEEVTQ